MEMAAKARDAEEIARVQKRVDEEVDQWVRCTAACVLEPAKDAVMYDTCDCTNPSRHVIA